MPTTTRAVGGLAGRAGSWSARRPWSAILLWVAVVALGTVVGSGIGSRQLTAADQLVGESARAERLSEEAGDEVPAGEYVLVQNVSGSNSGPALDVSMKQLGVGLAVAVLLDATVVRSVLLPASMRLPGTRNWYLPRWLGWLPRIDHGSPAPALSGVALPAPRPPADPASYLVAR